MQQNSIVSILFLSAFLGFAPVIFYSWFFFLRRGKKFQKGKQPTALLGMMFFGGVAAVIFAFFTERFLIGFLPPDFGYCVANSPLCRTDSGFTIMVLALASFLIVGPIEEGFKYIALWSISFHSPVFTRIIDGAKFGVAVALGFAAAENALYLFSSLRVLDLNSFVSTFLLRFALSTLAHTLYTGIMGYYFGKANFKQYGRWRTIGLGLFLAIITHGLFDFVLFSQIGFYAVIILVFLFATLYLRFKAPENFAVRIPEFIRRHPKAQQKIYSIPVESDLRPADKGLGVILAETPEQMRPIMDKQIKPEYLPKEVPSEFAAIKREAPVKKSLTVPKATVRTRSFAPAINPLRTRVATARPQAPRVTKKVPKLVPVIQTLKRPSKKTVAPSKRAKKLSARDAKSIVKSSVDQVKKRRLNILPPSTTLAPSS